MTATAEYEESLTGMMNEVALELLGKPNDRLSDKQGGTLRFGNQGSIEVNIKEGWFSDYECKVSGGVLELLAHKAGLDHAGAFRWLEEKGIKQPSEDGGAHRSIFYDYRDEKGAVLFRVERKQRGREKTFLQHGPDGQGGFVCRSGCMRGVRRVLYRLPELMAAPLDAIIFVAEGEKCADRLVEAGLIATTNAGGALKFDASLAEALAGRRVIVLQDNDDAGRRHAEDVLRKVSGVAASAAVLALPGGEKSDVFDWLRNGGSAFELLRLSEEAIASAAEKKGNALHATPYSWPDPREIPTRPWLFGHWLLRGELTGIIAPGGVGKSTIGNAIALSLASGQKILGKSMPRGPQKAWIYNLEDDQTELNRQISAVSLFYDIGPAECGDRIMVDSGLDQPLCTATDGPDGFKIAEDVFTQLEETIIQNRISVVTVDPFVSSHMAQENDNGAIDAIAKRWKRLAQKCGCAVVLVHHTKKTGGREITAEDGRGGVALRDACRILLILNPMSKQEAEELGISDPALIRSLVRIDEGKVNRAPPGSATWIHLQSQSLENGHNGEPSDYVGVATLWEKPDVFHGLSAWHLYEVQQRVKAGEWRENSQAKDWVGHAVAAVAGLSVDDDKGRIKAIIKSWKNSGALATERRADKNGDERPYIVVGKPVDPSEIGVRPHPQTCGAESAESADCDPC